MAMVRQLTLAMLTLTAAAHAACTTQKVGNDYIFSGCNVHIRNGTGSTNVVNGLGNLIVGYNENSNPTQPRGGSHNLIVGREHGYTSFGGLVSGHHNQVANEAATVVGGQDSVASGEYAVVSGGQANSASGPWAAVSGGTGNQASGPWTSISGGINNSAVGDYSWVGTGYGNVTNAPYSSIAAGLFNTTNDYYASITGGNSNTASGYLSVICGGAGNQTIQVPNAPLSTNAVVCGGAGNVASYSDSTVSGGCSVATTATCQAAP